LELLRKQQMIRAVVESEFSHVQEALARYTAVWYRFRAVGPDSGFNQKTAIDEVRQVTEDALKQSELGTSVSQATLITTLPADNLNAGKNIELAQTMARETLVLVGQIKEASDDLLLLQELLATELLASKSGLAKAWNRSSLAVASAWDSMVRIAEVSLFEIGDVPVTPEGLVKMIFVLVFAFAVSWLIRYLLNRGIGRDKVAKRAAAYTLGRLLHYLIILIGLFVALSTIGIDFSSFALIAGALSVGIGFGLQAIVNNFVSGLILLFEGTLRVGDFVELDKGLQGVVREINTRATLINTNDGVDVVVPNSELVTTRLTNWTLRESSACLRVPFGVA
ncbi:MAG: mechanosensitive ion channel family protein, partial [Methylocella sp.]